MTTEEQRELNRYQAYYNANKLAYLMSQNNENLLTLEEEDKLKPPVEKLPDLKNINEHPTVKYLRDRNTRLGDTD